MNKIIKLALGLSYPTDKLTALQEVISATPNAQMATEILLGVYEKPNVPSKVKTKEGQIRVLKSVDFWINRVYFTFLKGKRIGAYYPKGTDEKTLNDNNWQSLKCSSGDNTIYLYFTSTEMEEKEDYCDLDVWLSYEDITPKRVFDDIYFE